MGNKQSKAIYDLIETAFKDQKIIANAQSAQSISDPEMVGHLLVVINEKVGEQKIVDVTKEMKLNVQKEETKEEKEAKEQKAKETKLQSILVAGHEMLPEIKAIFEGATLEDYLSPTKEDVGMYSKRIVDQFMSAILIMLSKEKGSGEAASFCSRVGSCLKKSVAAGSTEIECSGASTAIYFSALLIDPSKLMTDPYISANLLSLFQTMEPLSFYGWTKKAVIIDNSIDHIKDSLIKQLDIIIKETPTKVIPNIENLIKTICYIGLATGSIEDLLIAIELIVKFKASFDMKCLLEKVLELPKVSEFLEICSIDLKKESLEYQIPFEKIYIDKTDWIVERELSLSSAADGDYVYFYSSVHGLLCLGVGNTLQKGKIYTKSGFLECKTKVQLVTIKNKLYCWSEGKLNRLYPETLKMKPTKKSECLPSNSSLLLTSSGDMIITYMKTQKEAPTTEGEVIEEFHGELIFYDTITKKEVNIIQVTHTISDLQQILACGDFIIFAGKRKYEVFSTISQTIIKSEESDLLKQSTISVNSNTYEIFVIFHVSDDDGIALGKFEALSLKEEKVQIMNDRLKQVKELLDIDSKDETAVERKEIYTLLHMSTEKDNKKAIEPIFTNRLELMLALLAIRAKEAESSVKATKLDNDNVMKFYNTPMAVHLTMRSFEIQVKLAELFFSEANEGKTEESIALALEKLTYIIIILNQHMLSLRKCNISLSECAGSNVNEMFERVYHKILLPIVKENLLQKFALKNADLMNSLKTNCDICIKNSQLLAPVETGLFIQTLIQSLEKILAEKKTEESFHGLITSFNSPSNIDLIATKILDKDPTCLKLLDMYFGIENLYFNLKSQDFLKGEFNHQLSAILKELSLPFSSVFEKLFEKIG